MSYLAVIKKYGNGYSAYIPEIPKEQTDLVVIKFDKNLIPLKN